jgi:intracellular septation protein
MKLLFDFLPIILFFAAFNIGKGNAEAAARLATEHLGFMVQGGVVGPKEAPILLATVVVIAATLAQVAWVKLRGRKVDTMLWVSLALVTVFGGATIWFNNETFIKWKPTVLYWVMGAAFVVMPLLTGRNLLRTLLGEQLELPGVVWQRLSLAWMAFFAAMGVLNLWVAYSFDTAVWVNFKLFGGIGLTVLFTLAQAVYLSRYLKPDDTPAQAPGAPDAP